MLHQRVESPRRLNGLKAARRFFVECLAEADPTIEHLWIAHIDDAARCIHLSRHDGEEGAATLPLRAVLADAVRHGSAAIILAHNHPSGDATPSAADRALTRRLALIGEAMGLVVIDHLVMTADDCSSMRAMNLI